MTETVEQEVGVEPASAPTPTSTAITPAGVEIAYYTEPKRMYQVRLDSDWREVPSVTTVLEVLDKPALPWWGMKVGAIGVAKLIEAGTASIVTTDAGPRLAVLVEGTWYFASEENLADMLSAAKLTTNHVKNEAGQRGQSAHDALEAYAAIGTIPNPDDYPPEEKPYIIGLCRFLDAIRESFEPEAFEVMVGSVEHGFAGRYDLRGTFHKEVRVVAAALTTKGEPYVRGPKWTTIPAGTKALLDLKTSKGVYESHLLQLEGYEGASIEDGYEPTDARAVVHVTSHGLYELKRVRASFEDFLAILHTYHALDRVREGMKG